ncbi:hypothetical protein [Streptomyces sp. B22F1]|uniref:hypothetical protein n=1 Tax=Streptomyces sp. B22F1 TaxID=3153566 RepID=UPI00325DDD87
MRRGGRRHRVLAGVFADLLTGDCLVQAGLRMLARAPESAPAAAAAQYVAAALRRHVLDDLAGAPGARVHEPGPAGEAFRRTACDLAAAGLGPAGHRGSLGTLVAHLRLLAAGVPGSDPPRGLFRPGSSPAPPEVPFDAARLAPAARADVLTTALLDAAARPRPSAHGPPAPGPATVPEPGSRAHRAGLPAPLHPALSAAREAAVTARPPTDSEEGTMDEDDSVIRPTDMPQPAPMLRLPGCDDDDPTEPNVVRGID